MSGIDAQREPQAEPERTETDDAVRRIMRHGRTATAFRAAGRDLRHFEVLGHDALIAYAAPAGAMVAAGEPIAALDALVPAAEAFVAYAQRAGRRASFFATEGRLTRSPALQRWLIGEQPVWDPRAWTAHLAAHRSLREQVRRARAKGVEVRSLDQATFDSVPVRHAVTTLLTRWRAARSMATMHFLVEVDLTSGGALRRHVAAWHDGTLVALLSMAPVPARNGWLFEHLLRDPDAPNGTLELLVDHAMRLLAAEQVEWATLGLAPLHGDVHPVLRRLRRWSTPLFNFEGLVAFKRKLRPTRWEPIYLAWPVDQSGVRALVDGLRAFAGGSLLRFGARTVLRGPVPLLALLEWSLVPWTLALALVPTTPWFPSASVHAAWVAFDGALLLSLRFVRRAGEQYGAAARTPRARRQTARAATAVAVAVTIDAVLTSAQAVLWNAPHQYGTPAWSAVLIACVAPAAAAVVLWGAAQRLRMLARARPALGALLFTA